MTTPAPFTPLPGMFGLADISGALGRLIGWGQAIVDRRPAYDAAHHRRVPTHAFLVVDGGWVVEAEPSGAQMTPVADYLTRPDVVWCDAPVQSFLAEHHLRPGSTDEAVLRTGIATVGRSLVDTPYSFLDYLDLGLLRYGIRLPGLRHRLNRDDKLICSALCAFAFHEAGIDLFGAHGNPMDVTPGNLYAYAMAHADTEQATAAGRAAITAALH